MEQQKVIKKRRNIIFKVITVILVILLMIGISAGVETVMHKDDAIPASSTFVNGLSAYELASEYGYEGSVQDWLDSLTGKSAYEIAVDNGYSGTESEWVSALEAAMNQNAVGIKGAAFNEKGELLITLSDNTVLNLGNAVGARR